MPANTYDAIIVGSGITGGWAAKELTEKGLNTLVLEAGRTIDPGQDYVEHVPVWELKYRNWDDRAKRQKTQPVQREVGHTGARVIILPLSREAALSAPAESRACLHGARWRPVHCSKRL